MRLLGLALWCASAVAQPAYVGAQTCRGCHPSQWESQSKTGHAASLAKPSATLPVDKRYRRGAVEFHYTPSPFQVHAADSRETIDLPVDWAFGAGTQATTFVSRISSEWYLEHYLSYYPKLGGFAATPGHAETAPPKSLKDAVGVVYPALDPKSGILGCFECHSTGPALRNGEIHPTELGVRCEACHGAGSVHAKTAAKKDVRNPAKLTPAAMNTMCGRCHRPPASSGENIDWNYAWNLRHQPVYLSQSRCFQKAQLTCLTCHAAHDPLRMNDASYYRDACMSCHAKSHKPAPACATDCVSCHMPRVSPQTGLIFHNHWIGVYEKGRFLKPRR